MGDVDTLLNQAIVDALRTNLFGAERTRAHNGRMSIISSLLSNRYFNTPPTGGYRVNEEQEYIFADDDDISSLIFLDIATRFGSPHSDTETKLQRANKIKQQIGKYTKVKENTENECPICLEKIIIGEFERKLTCTHCFHKKCIDRWFKKDNDSCPMCRLKIIS